MCDKSGAGSSVKEFKLLSVNLSKTFSVLPFSIENISTAASKLHKAS